MPDESDDTEALFPLIGKMDRPLVEEITKAVRNCFRRSDITAEQIHHLAVLLFALERLPLATPGVHVSLTLSYRGENEMSCQSIDLDESSFTLSTGGSVYDPSVGTDSYGDDVLMVEVGGFRDAKWMQFVDWLSGFKNRLEDAEIKTDLDDSSNIDWSEGPDESAWERAAKQYDSEDESGED
jgi:hypothetical protein